MQCNVLQQYSVVVIVHIKTILQKKRQLLVQKSYDSHLTVIYSKFRPHLI